MRSALVALVVLFAACDKGSSKPAEPSADEKPKHAASAPAVDAGPALEPLVELPPAAEIPADPAGLPTMEDSKDNPTTAEKVALGNLLFFEKRLSADGTMACAGCHYPDKAWTDDRAVSPKVGGAMNVRNAPTMLNVGYHSAFYWDGRMPTLEKVVGAAWKGQLGAADKPAIAAKLNAVPQYRAHFNRAFKRDATADDVELALAAWLRTLKSGGSAFDKLQGGDKKALSADAAKGWSLFQKSGCVACHTPPLFTDLAFHNAGIGWDAAKRDQGRTDATKDAADEGKFKTPTLRDVSMTGPYFHDGSAATLDDAIAVMAAGGKKNPKLDPLFKPKKLSKKDLGSLKAFLEALKGEETWAKAPDALP